MSLALSKGDYTVWQRKGDFLHAFSPDCGAALGFGKTLQSHRVKSEAVDVKRRRD